MKTNLLDSPVLFKDPDYQKRILIFDIETAPNLAYVWGKYEQNTLAVEQHWYMLCFAYKWLGEKETFVYSLPDFKTYKKDKTDDKELIQKLWELFDRADIIIAHNGDAFDIKKANARFLKHGFEPPSPYKTIDTLKIARKHFKLDSNKLDDLGDFFHIGRKIQTGGFNLWLGCLNGDKDAWKHMTDYNKQDVILLEKVYYKLRGWSTSGVNLNTIFNCMTNCHRCNSEHVIKAGFDYTAKNIYQSYRCKNCGHRPRGEILKRNDVK